MSQSNAEANRLMEQQSLGGSGGWADLDDDEPDDYDEAADALDMPEGDGIIPAEFNQFLDSIPKEDVCH